jgi:hypothetical protein
MMKAGCSNKGYCYDRFEKKTPVIEQIKTVFQIIFTVRNEGAKFYKLTEIQLLLHSKARTIPNPQVPNSLVTHVLS